METKIKGEFYNTPKFEIVKPMVVDISENDYQAESFRLNNTVKEEQHPFYICETEVVTLKVEPFYTGIPITWSFLEGFPIPLRRIFSDAGNSKTSIQIGY